MIVRKINDSEYKRTCELFSIAFEFGADNDKTNEEMLLEMQNKEQGRGDMYYHERWASFTDDNQMMSFIIATPYEVNFDGHECKMTGIGAVSSLPQYRRSGGVRACFEKSIPDMYDQGYDFSYLYPFSTAYYRKFGYELSGKVMLYELSMLNMPRFNEVSGTAHLNEKGSELDGIKQVYEVFSKKYNMMVARKEFDYIQVKNNNPATDKHYMYVYKDSKGTPLGVMSFRKEEHDGKRVMACSNIWFVNLDGLKGVFNHILAYASNFEKVKFNLPTDVDISMLIPEWSLNGSKIGQYNMGMARVVNVKKVLEKARYKGDGECVIEVQDDIVSENNNKFKVTFKQGVAVSVENVEGKTEFCEIESDIFVSINQFSRLILGEYDLDMAQYDDKVVIKKNISMLEKVFYKKPIFLCDYF